MLSCVLRKQKDARMSAPGRESRCYDAIFGTRKTPKVNALGKREREREREERERERERERGGERERENPSGTLPYLVCLHSPYGHPTNLS